MRSTFYLLESHQSQLRWITISSATADMWQIFKLNSQLIISLALQAIEAELSWAASSEKSSTSRIWFKVHTIDDKWAQLVSRHQSQSRLVWREAVREMWSDKCDHYTGSGAESRPSLISRFNLIIASNSLDWLAHLGLQVCTKLHSPDLEISQLLLSLSGTLWPEYLQYTCLTIEKFLEELYRCLHPLKCFRDESWELPR